MRRAVCLLLGFLALGAVVEASRLSDALDEIPKVTADDVARVLKDLHDSIQQHAKEAAAAFAAKHPGGVVDKLLGGSKRRLQTIGQSFQSWLEEFYGTSWQEYVPENWSLPSFDWSSLGEFDYSSNLGDFMAANDLHNYTRIHSMQDLAAAAAAIEAAFCEPEGFAPAAKVPASCSGPTVTISLTPKTCVLEAATKQVVCDPAKLVLTKSPGSCTHKYISGSAWKGKECKISGGAGFAKNATIGGGIKEIPMVDLTIDYEP